MHVPEARMYRNPASPEFMFATGIENSYYVITHHYYERYHRPIMHTETNQRQSDEPVHWLRRQWANVVALKHDDVPLIGFTWFSLVDQVDWDSTLTRDKGHVDLAGLDRKLHEVGRATRRSRRIRARCSRRTDTRLTSRGRISASRTLGCCEPRTHSILTPRVSRKWMRGILNVEEHARLPRR